jgi:hypothetical protein
MTQLNDKSSTADAASSSSKDGRVVIVPAPMDNLKFWGYVIGLQCIYSAVFMAVAVWVAVKSMSYLQAGNINPFHWLAEGPGFRIENAGPGVTLAIVAAIIVYITRLDVGLSNIGETRAALTAKDQTPDQKAEPKSPDPQKIEIPVPIDHPRFWLGAVIVQFVQSMFWGAVAVYMIHTGMDLIAQGLDFTKASWSLEFWGFRLHDLGPGTFLSGAGAWLISITKFDVVIKNVARGRSEMTARIPQPQPQAA